MFGVNEGARATNFLHFGNDVQRKRRLTGTFRTVDLDDTSARQTAHAQSQVKAQRTGAHHLNILGLGTLAHTHDRALTKFLFNVGQGRGQRLFAFIRIIDALNSRFRARILFLLSHLSISFCLGIGFSKNIDRYFLSPILCTLFPFF